jgi:hypothetical protein
MYDRRRAGAVGPAPSSDLTHKESPFFKGLGSRRQTLVSSERRRGVAFSLAGALCSAIYLFPYKRAAAFVPADTLAFALLVMAALSSSLWSLWQRTGSRPRVSLARGLLWRTALVLSLATITGNFCGA